MRGVRWAAISVCAVVLLSCAPPPAECPKDDPGKQTWIATRFNVEGIFQTSPKVAQHVFGHPESYIVESWQVWPWADKASRVGAWASAEQFARDVEVYGKRMQDMDAVLYDPEPWSATPKSEQEDPETAMAAFAKTAAGLDLPVIITPGLGLGERLDCAGDLTGAAPTYKACNIAGMAARYADIVEVQTQSFQQDPEAYDAIVTSTAAQAHAENPDVKVLAGLRVRGDDDIELVKRSWAAVSDTVDGHYLAMDPSDAVPFLTWVTECSA